MGHLNLSCTLQNNCAAGSLDLSNPAHFKIALVAQRQSTPLVRERSRVQFPMRALEQLINITEISQISTLTKIQSYLKQLVFNNATIVIPNAQNLSCSDHELYGLGSDDPEELAYYKIRKEIDDIKKQPIKKEFFAIGIHRRNR